MLALPSGKWKKYFRSLCSPSAQAHAAEAGVSRIRGVQRGNRFDPIHQTEVAKWSDRGESHRVHAHLFGQEFCVADARQARFFLFGIQSRKIVFLFAAQAATLLARLFRDRRFGHEVRPGIGRGDGEIVGFAAGKRTRIVDQFVDCQKFLCRKKSWELAPWSR